MNGLRWYSCNQGSSVTSNYLSFLFFSQRVYSSSQISCMPCYMLNNPSWLTLQLLFYHYYFSPRILLIIMFFCQALQNLLSLEKRLCFPVAGCTLPPGETRRPGPASYSSGTANPPWEPGHRGVTRTPSLADQAERPFLGRHTDFHVRNKPWPLTFDLSSVITSWLGARSVHCFQPVWLHTRHPNSLCLSFHISKMVLMVVFNSQSWYKD